jgi:hypothetical protein
MNACPSGMSCAAASDGTQLIHDPQGRCWNEHTCDEDRGSLHDTLKKNGDRDAGWSWFGVVVGKLVAIVGWMIAGVTLPIKADIINALADIAAHVVPLIDTVFGSDSGIARFIRGLRFAFEAALAGIDILLFMVGVGTILGAEVTPLKSANWDRTWIRRGGWSSDRSITGTSVRE